MCTIGQFDGQTDVGGALAPGSASYDAASKTYTINSAGYNIWYQRDEFRYLWKKMSGDISLAATVHWPNIDDFHDRKVVLIFRDSLDDDSRQIMAAQHGNGMVHISWRAEKGGQMTDVEYRSARQPRLGTDEKGAADFPSHPYRHREEGRCLPALHQLAGRAAASGGRAGDVQNEWTCSMSASVSRRIWRRMC